MITRKFRLYNNKFRKSSKWSPPPKSWYKLNFDGASRGNLGKVGAGFMIHNPNSGICAKGAFILPPSTNNEPKLEGLVEGLKMSFQLKISNIIIERDSQIIFNALHR